MRLEGWLNRVLTSSELLLQDPEHMSGHKLSVTPALGEAEIFLAL